MSQPFGPVETPFARYSILDDLPLSLHGLELSSVPSPPLARYSEAHHQLRLKAADNRILSFHRQPLNVAGNFSINA